ncbi:unnamed protein product [Hymenolepis diminuta]|uniref:FYVE, RhoGEF and PH domain-containing protein 4 n=1 Tax=Hymenolepis diminuta TaxID=6216 RepID=A0A564YPW1_HYMDI|nr:unnamed protein product [Hymenolepis diminuta]
MENSESFALKVDFLIPDLFKNKEQKKPERPVCRSRRGANAVSTAIRAIYQQNEQRKMQSPLISLELESRNRVKTLLASAKDGSFGIDEPAPSQKKIKKLENLSKELFDTEKRYLESLRVLKEISDRVQTIESDHKEVLRDVFKEIPSLYMLHSIIDERFYKTPDKESNFAWFIQIFTSAEISPFMNIYRAFLARVGEKYETLQSIYEKDKLFQQYCQSLVLTSKFSKQHVQNIPGMYIGIQSRLMRYQLLLQKILDLLPDGIDKERCDCALKITVNVLKSSEEEVTKNEMISKAILINSKLEGRKNSGDKLSLFIRSGPCLKIPRRSVNRKPLNRHLFLFSDYLILTEPEILTTGHYIVKSELTIVSMILEEPKIEDDIPVEKCIRIRAVECVVELMFADENEKNSWWKSLEETIEQERHRNNVMLSAVPRWGSNVQTSRAAEWVKDEQATMCALCYRRFTHVRRRHHCRACGKIFCGTCSGYKAVVENLGPAQVRVCEVDYYRLNPDIKPQTAAALERIAQFSESGQKYAPYHCGYIMFTSKVRSQWPHRKTHVRVEYSAGLVSREHSPSQISIPTSPPSAHTSNNLESLCAQNPPSPFLSRPTRKMSLDFANLRQTSINSTTDHSNGAACSSTIMPLPAARLIVRPHTSRVFCVLQPDTLLAIYAAKGDAKSCDSVILLGTRLLYLVRLSGQGNSLTSSSRDSVSNSRTSSSSNDDAISLQNFSNKKSPGTSLPERKITVENNPVDFYKRISAIKTPLALVAPSVALRKAEEQESDLDELDVDSDHNSLKHSEDSSSPSPGVPSTPNGKPETLANALTTNMGGVSSPISVDTLSVLSNMNGFLILPNNTDKVAHYFEAPSEEVRNVWIEKIKNCVVEFDHS